MTRPVPGAGPRPGTRPPGPRPAAWLVAVLVALSGCGDEEPPAPSLSRPSPATAATSTTPTPPAPLASRAILLREVGAESGIDFVPSGAALGAKRWLLETVGTGCAMLDYDGDGDLDLYLVDAGSVIPPPGDGAERIAAPGTVPSWLDPADGRPARDGRSRLFANDGTGRFHDVTEETGAGLSDFGVGATAQDYDGDGDPDLYVTCWGPNRLLRNEGGRFTDVTAEAGVGDPRWSVGSCFLDADLDGDLDLYVANYFAMTVRRDPDCWRKIDCPYLDLVVACGPKGMIPEPDTLYRNRGDGTFEDASDAFGIHDVDPCYGMGVVAFDHDQDGDVDLYVANDSRGNFLFDNQGGKEFVEIGDLAGVSRNRDGRAQAGMGIATGDVDGDLDPDLYVTNFSHDLDSFYRNDGGGEFLDLSERCGLGQDVYFALAWGTGLVDIDNDGALELFVACGHIYPEADRRRPELAYRLPDRVYRWKDGTWRDVSTSAGPGLARVAASRGAAFGDLDNDGDLDAVVMAMDARPSVLRNEPDTPAGGYLEVTLEAQGGNRDAVGARVVATIGGTRVARFVTSGHSFASSSDPRIHFGLGAARAVDRLAITWPDGTRQVLENIPRNRWILVREGEDWTNAGG